MVVIDISDLTRPRTISRLGWEEGGHTHTALPLPDRNLVVVTDEAVTEGCDGDRHMVRIVDVTDETAPFVRSICPVPEGDFCERGLRFGAHCLHENRPNSYRSQELMFVTYFNAGLRVYDVADPDAPRRGGPLDPGVSTQPGSGPDQRRLRRRGSHRVRDRQGQRWRLHPRARRGTLRTHDAFGNMIDVDDWPRP